MVLYRAAADTDGMARGLQAGEQSVGLHLVAALQALRREAELLEPHQRNHLAGLLRDAAAATPAVTTPAGLVANPNRGSAARPPTAAPQPGASPGGGGSGGGGGRALEEDGAERESLDEPGASIFQAPRVTGGGAAALGLGWGAAHPPVLSSARGSREGLPELEGW